MNEQEQSGDQLGQDLAALRQRVSELEAAEREHQRAQDEIRRLKEFSEGIVLGVAEALVVEDAAGIMTFVNPAMERLLGYTAQELLGRHWRYIVAAADVPLIEARVHLRPLGIGERYESHLLSKDGRQVPVLISARPIFRGEQFASVLSACTDITELKKAEHALHQHAAELKWRNDELDAFADAVAHELRGPLTNILAFASLLNDDDGRLSAQQKQEFYQWLKRSAQGMSNVIDSLLLLAKVSKPEQMELLPLDMDSIVAAAIDRLTYMIHNAQAQVLLPDRWPVAVGNGDWVGEVWLNLLSNAIKYGGQPPRVELGAQVESGNRVRFWVSDNGQGLTPEEQAVLFVRGGQLQRSLGLGHGLGLSIVRRIVEKLGGQVGVQSAAGQGSTFFFNLPGPEGQPSAVGESTSGDTGQEQVPPGAMLGPLAHSSVAGLRT